MTGGLGPIAGGTRVLVTGCRGFIGSAVMRQNDLHDGLTIIGTDRDEADLCDEHAVMRLIERTQPDRIVHLAGTLIKSENPTAFQQQWDNTFVAGTHLIKAAVAQGIRQVLIPGSIDELGNQHGVLGPELATKPRSAYGLCKCLLREFAGYWASRKPMRVDWFRPFVVYGPGQIRGQMLLPTAFRAAKLGARAAFSDGIQRRDFIHVDDIADWILRALHVKLEVSEGVLKIHHLGTGEGVPVCDVLRKIAEAFPEAQLDIGAIPRRPGEPLLEVSAPYSCADKPLDSWRPKYDWERGVTQTCDWWRGLDESVVSMTP